MKTVTTFNWTTHFSALRKVVDVVGDDHVRVKRVTAYLALFALIVTGVGVVIVHWVRLITLGECLTIRSVRAVARNKAVPGKSRYRTSGF